MKADSNPILDNTFSLEIFRVVFIDTKCDAYDCIIKVYTLNINITFSSFYSW